MATAGLGVGLSVLFGLLAFVGMIAMCCRCKRLHREDLAIAQAEGDDDGELPVVPACLPASCVLELGSELSTKILSVFVGFGCIFCIFCLCFSCFYFLFFAEQISPS